MVLHQQHLNALAPGHNSVKRLYVFLLEGQEVPGTP